MKILQIIKLPEDTLGGIELIANTLSEYLANNNQEIEVVTSNVNSSYRETRYKNFVCRNLPTWFTIFSTPVCPSLVGYLRRAQGFDIINLALPNPMGAIAYLLARPKGKLVVWYHSDIAQVILNIIFLPILLAVFKKASYIVASNNKLMESSGILKKFRHKVTVIPYGINIAEFNNENDNMASISLLREKFSMPFVLFVGRLVYYKGLNYLIKAMKDIDAKLVIAGEGVLENKLKLLTKKLGISNKIFFAGKVEGTLKAQYMHACDLLVLPSTHKSEAFGIVLLEAMACAKPVVTTELGTGTSFVCQNNVTGLVVPPKDIPALKNAINQILHDRDFSRKLGEASRRRLEENFRIEKMGEEFLSLYQRVLS